MLGKLFEAISGKKRFVAADESDCIMVIGLGRFGTAVAKSLVNLGHQVLAVDANSERVQNLADELPHVVQADTSDPELLKQLGVLDRHLAGKDWIMGSDYTIADIAVFPWVRNLIGFYDAAEIVGFERFRNVQAWLDRGLARPAVQRGLLVCAA